MFTQEELEQKIFGPKPDAEKLFINKNAIRCIGVEKSFILANLVESDYNMSQLNDEQKYNFYKHYGDKIIESILEGYFPTSPNIISYEVMVHLPKVKKYLKELQEQGYISIIESKSPKQKFYKINRLKINRLYLGVPKNE